MKLHSLAELDAFWHELDNRPKQRKPHVSRSQRLRDRAIELRYAHGLTYAQIGERLGVCKQRVHQLLSELSTVGSTE